MDNFLKGTRFNKDANDQYKMMLEDYELIEFGSKEWIDVLKNFVSKHIQSQVPRLKELKRYYLGDNNIKYREVKSDEFAPDNRIASDFAHYITIFEQGYMLGKPVQYKNEDKSIQQLINEFITENNEEYHNVLLKTDLSIYGRAYELVFAKDGEVRLFKLNTEQTFIIYDDTYEQNSLMGVNYYSVDYGGGKRKEIIKVYTSDAVYHYENYNQNNKGFILVDEEEHFFNGVPVNEYSNDNDRLGTFESVLDNIDAYDLSQSELANSQQESTDSMLVITGNPYTGADDHDFNEDGTLNPNGRLAVSRAFKKAKVLIMDDNPNPDGAKPDAKYLVKSYDAKGAEEYKKRLVNDILRFTFTPDTTDMNFGGQQSGEAMKYKLMGSDNLRSQRERLFKKGLMRRLRLSVNIWKIKGNDSLAYDLINKTSIIFTPNIPQNDVELIQNAKQLHGVVSDETVFEIIGQVTGVQSSDELARIQNSDLNIDNLQNSRRGDVIHEEESQ